MRFTIRERTQVNGMSAASFGCRPIVLEIIYYRNLSINDCTHNKLSSSIRTSKSCEGSILKAWISSPRSRVQTFPSMDRKSEGSWLKFNNPSSVDCARTPPRISHRSISFKTGIRSSRLHFELSQLDWCFLRASKRLREVVSEVFGPFVWPEAASSMMYCKEVVSLISSRKREQTCWKMLNLTE